MSDRTRRVAGWCAAAVSAVLASLWGFWGAIETFHEGWYHASFAANVAMTLGQYLAPMLAFAGAGALAVRFPRTGGALHAAGAAAAAWHFRGAAPLVVGPFIVAPLVLLGGAYFVGRATPRNRAVGLVLGLPLLVACVSGAGPAVRVAARHEMTDRGARRVTANGADLVWAPAGPGWPGDGVPWEEARRRCRHLTADGTSLAETPQDVWRLPTLDEAVRSAARHGVNCAGVWDPGTETASYATTPDKEPPLWDPRSKVIYWWTANERDERTAWIVVYDGKAWPRPKSAHWGYLGFRAVRDP